VDAPSLPALRALHYLRDCCAEGRSLEELAGDLGCSGRHLRRVFQEAYHVTPVEYLETCRLLLAKQLLTQTDLSVLDTAMTAGFGSVRRMNELFLSRYGLSPTAVRKREKKESGGNLVRVSLGYRTPYAWDEILSFLQDHAIPHVEQVTEQSYARTVRLAAGNGDLCTGVVLVTNDEKSHALEIRMSESLAAVMPQVLSGIRQLFDLDCDPGVIWEKLSGMALPSGRPPVPGIRLPGSFDAFETACRVAAEEDSTAASASALCGRIAEAYGPRVETGIPGLDRAFPDPEMLKEAGEDAEGAQEKIRTMKALAAALDRKDGIRLSRAADPEAEIRKLLEIPGIGRWSAGCIAMRTMGWTDAFPECDPDPTLQKQQEAWKPWRSYAWMQIRHADREET
jgi:AraC family transcriptional regulator of adaptative response / DNA-3-methyladenine glycosylase II